MPNWSDEDGRYWYTPKGQHWTSEVEIPHPPVNNPPGCTCICCEETRPKKRKKPRLFAPSPLRAHKWRLLTKSPGFEMHWCERCGVVRYEHSRETTVYLQPGRRTDPDTNGVIPPCKENS